MCMHARVRAQIWDTGQVYLLQFTKTDLVEHNVCVFLYFFLYSCVYEWWLGMVVLTKHAKVSLSHLHICH